MIEPLILNLRVFTVKLVGVRNFRKFTINSRLIKEVFCVCEGSFVTISP